jgi:hypothetical protein
VIKAAGPVTRSSQEDLERAIKVLKPPLGHQRKEVMPLANPASLVFYGQDIGWLVLVR